MLLLTSVPAYASLTFNPIFASSITDDTVHAAAIEANIDAVLAVYSLDFSNNVTVPITFGEMTTGLGESSFFFDQVSYHTYCADLVASATSASDLAANASLGSCGSNNSQTNPVNGTTSVELKFANANALGINDVAPGGTDGTILINTEITDAGTGICTSGCYSFDATLEHEIDEILGLGSDLENVQSGSVPTFSANPTPEDLFRYSAAHTRSFNAGVSCGSLGTAYFSIDGGVTDLAGFDNSCDGGDFGDWDSGSARVQNAFAAGGNPPLGVELTALDVVGYTLTSTTPEPATVILTGGALGLLMLLRRRRV